MYADEHKANELIRKVHEYWGNGYMANQLTTYLERKHEEDTKPKKIKAKSAVLHRKPDND
jgi:hypothetical protein